MLDCLRDAVCILTLSVCLGCGCSYGPVNTPAFPDDSDVRRIDPNNGPFVIELEQAAAEDGNEPRSVHVIKWKRTRVTGTLAQNRSLSVRYKPFYFHMFSQPTVEVQMPGGHRCTALLDTGYSGAVYVSDLAVRRSNLAVFPLGEHSGTGCPQGFCDIPSMKIGTVTIENPPCWYEQRHWQLSILGVPLYRHEVILLGLGMMSKFSHVLFDNPNRRVTFYPQDEFRPDELSRWVCIPFVLEQAKGGLRLMVDISVAGQEARVEFDTCGAKPGLILRQETWQRIASGLKARSHGKTLHQSWQFGWHWSRRYVLPEFNIGQLTLKNTKVNVLPADDELLKNCEGIITFDRFKDTEVVLDFKKNLLWVRKS